MFITSSKPYPYNRAGEQVAAGLFLMLVSNPDASFPIRALVRHVRMRQVGHFMMGSARVGPHNLTVSGSYGADGLVMNVPEDVYARALELPQELYDAWNTGGSWNSAGSEAPSMRQWARANLERLRQ